MMQGATESERLERGWLFESEDDVLIFSDSHWATFFILGWVSLFWRGGIFFAGCD